MNLKSKLLMVVSMVTVGLSSSNAAGLPTNPEDTMTLTEALAAAVQRGDTKRVQELTGCLNAMDESFGITATKDTQTIAEGLAAAEQQDGRGQELIELFNTMAKVQKIFQGIADDWNVLKAETETAGVAKGAVPSSEADLKTGSEVDKLSDALSAFCDKADAALNAGTALEADGNPEESLKNRVVKACKSPGVSDLLLNKFISAFSRLLKGSNRTWDNVNDAELTDYIDQFLRSGRF